MTSTANEAPAMVELPAPPNEDWVTVAGLRQRVLSGGDGRPLVVLHHSTGNLGWLPFHDELAEQHHVFVPDLPGWGQSERPEWAREVRDIAVLVHRALDRLGLDDVAVVGLGLGGWVAVELACWAQSRISSLTLVGSPGPQPREGEILDQIMVDYHEYVRAGFSDDGRYLELFGERPPREIRRFWDLSREMTARITWKPYMFSRQLIHVLPEVDVPTLLVWGDNDDVVPIDVAKQYEETMPRARLTMLEQCGHLADLERPRELAQLVLQHVDEHS